ncbi:hypothetical protein NLU13_3998 [Sarocladium strictum]|uniref:FAD/NAD(P)-binding domain-containing protein n=1 Tax=Sarocladium strictum TaxID=5046 RepID=A0AA39L884_SARSR|nr:hypothetical protein NLU13_3998 [Sarocladium strictum]
MSTSADVLILGAGPAGLTAAISLARQMQSSIVFDDGAYRNDPAEYMHLIPGFDHVSPEHFRKTARENMLGNYEHISIRMAKVDSAEKDEATGRFTIKDDAGVAWQGKKLVLANGVEDVFPPIEGYGACWGKAIFHCLFCKGYEQRGQASAGVLAIGPPSANPAAVLHVARQVVPLSKKVTIYTNGVPETASALSSATEGVSVFHVDDREIEQFVLLEGNQGLRLQFKDGSSAEEAFLAHTPGTRPRGPFAQQLGLEQTPGGDVKAGPPFYQTSVKGVFAAGDNCGLMKNVPHAIFSGSLAGMGAQSQIVAEELGQKPLFG